MRSCSARHGVALEASPTRHHARELPARRDAVEPSARRTWRSSTPGYKALREEDVCGKGAKAVSFDAVPSTALTTTPASARTSRCSSSRRCSACSSRTGSSRLSRSRDAADPGAGRHRARRHPRRRQGAVGAVGSMSSRSSTTRSAQIFEMAGEEFNINSPQQLSRHPLRQAAAADAQAQHQDEDASRPPSRCSRSWR